MIGEEGILKPNEGCLSGFKGVSGWFRGLMGKLEENKREEVMKAETSWSWEKRGKRMLLSILHTEGPLRLRAAMRP